MNNEFIISDEKYLLRQKEDENEQTPINPQFNKIKESDNTIIINLNELDSIQRNGVEKYEPIFQIIHVQDENIYLISPSEDEPDDVKMNYLALNKEHQQELTLNSDLDENSSDELLSYYEVTDIDLGLNAVDQNYENNKNVKPEKKRYECPFSDCEKSFSTSYYLNVHVKSHLNLKPYKCPSAGCDKKFAVNYNLQVHIRVHTGEKPFCCNYCQKRFNTSGDLLKHTRIHTGHKPFSCPFEGCGKSFTTSNIRKVHMRAHTGERPYKCTNEHCGKAFSSMTNFKNHLRIHSGEKPFICPIQSCGKQFTEYSSLHKHKSVHRSNKECELCGDRKSVV